MFKHTQYLCVMEFVQEASDQISSRDMHEHRQKIIRKLGHRKILKIMKRNPRRTHEDVYKRCVNVEEKEERH